MNNFGIRTVMPNIDMSEVSSVKEMIFNKAREKSASMAAEKEEAVTQSVQNDVMAQARASISGTRMKPFGVLTQGTVKEPEPVEEVEKVAEEQTPARELKHHIQSVDNSVYTASVQNETMNAARNQFSRRASLADSLKFLNTQAAIQMVNKTHSKIV